MPRSVIFAREDACGIAGRAFSGYRSDSSSRRFSAYSAWEGYWEFYADGFGASEDDWLSEPGYVTTPNMEFVESELGADRTSSPETMNIVMGLFGWGDPSCEGYVDFDAER